MSYAATKRWRKKYPAKYKAQKLRYYEQSVKHATANYQRWTIEDLTLILKRTFCDSYLSILIGRSVKAIQVRRHRTLKTEP